jgi:hypothetical protein
MLDRLSLVMARRAPYRSPHRLPTVSRVALAAVALVGFAAAWIATFLIGIVVTGHWTCDGPCFKKWDDVALIAVAVGIGTAIIFATCVRWLWWRYFAKPS